MQKWAHYRGHKNHLLQQLWGAQQVCDSTWKRGLEEFGNRKQRGVGPTSALQRPGLQEDGSGESRLGSSSCLTGGFTVLRRWQRLWLFRVIYKPLPLLLEMLLLFSHSVVSSSFRPHGLQHTRPPCPSPNPGTCWNARLLSRWCHPTISSSVVPFSSCLQSFPAPGSFPRSPLFASGGQSIRASVSV